MIKVTMKIDGMSCGMCEAHINDAIRKVFSVKKVASSHRKGITELLIQDPVDTQLLKHAVEECGYNRAFRRTKTACVDCHGAGTGHQGTVSR